MRPRERLCLAVVQQKDAASSEDVAAALNVSVRVARIILHRLVKRQLVQRRRVGLHYVYAPLTIERANPQALGEDISLDRKALLQFYRDPFNLARRATHER